MPAPNETTYFWLKLSHSLGVKVSVLPSMSNVPSTRCARSSPKRLVLLRVKRSCTLARSIGMLNVIMIVVSTGASFAPSSGLIQTTSGGCVEKVQR